VPSHFLVKSVFFGAFEVRLWKRGGRCPCQWSPTQSPPPLVELCFGSLVKCCNTVPPGRVPFWVGSCCAIYTFSGSFLAAGPRCPSQRSLSQPLFLCWVEGVLWSLPGMFSPRGPIPLVARDGGFPHQRPPLCPPHPVPPTPTQGDLHTRSTIRRPPPLSPRITPLPPFASSTVTTHVYPLGRIAGLVSRDCPQSALPPCTLSTPPLHRNGHQCLVVPHGRCPDRQVPSPNTKEKRPRAPFPLSPTSPSFFFFFFAQSPCNHSFIFVRCLGCEDSFLPTVILPAVDSPVQSRPPAAFAVVARSFHRRPPPGLVSPIMVPQFFPPRP